MKDLAKEVRIGNMINWLYSDRTMKPVVIKNTDDIDAISSSPYSNEPIPLTEEWLERFGFVRPGNLETWFGRALWTKGDFGVIHGYGTSNGQRTKYDRREFDYVHQLQNLYFDLTGEELTIK